MESSPFPEETPERDRDAGFARFVMEVLRRQGFSDISVWDFTDEEWCTISDLRDSKSVDINFISRVKNRLQNRQPPDESRF